MSIGPDYNRVNPQVHSESSFPNKLVSQRVKDSSLTTYRSQDYQRTISRSSDAFAGKLSLQNDLTNVPETEVPAAIECYDTAHTQHSATFAFGPLDPFTT